MTPHPERLAWRVAGRIRDQLHLLTLNRLRNVRHDHCDLSTYLQRWQKLSRFVDLIGRRGWLGTLPSVRRNLDHLFSDLQRELTAARHVTARSEPLPVPSLRDLTADLAQLDDEFGEWTFDAAAGVLSVTTDPITLEYVSLGRFAIKLTIKQLAEAERLRIYRVEALQPNPAEGSDDVTHPHVRSEDLCEGEAAAPIKSALEQGRIADFFLLVQSVLTTYNPDSPYVRLDRWHGGSSCHDCGSETDEDNRSVCDRCDHEICSDCTTSCRCCGNYYCNDCLSTCPACEESTCQDCWVTCEQCNRRFCSNCVEDDICTSCREKQDDELTTTDLNNTPTPTVATGEHGDTDEIEDSGGGGGGGGGGGEEDDAADGLPAAEEEGSDADLAVLAVCLGEAAGVP